MSIISRALALSSALLFALLPALPLVPPIYFMAAGAQDGLLEDPVVKARRLIAARQYKECLEFIEPQALGPEKANPYIQYYYGSMLKYFGRRDEAIAKFEEILKTAPIGWLETKSKENLRQLKDAPQAKPGNQVGDSGVGYTGMKIKDDIILDVLAGSTAEKARLIKGDRILSIDGTPTRGLGSDGVATRVRGPLGSTVNLVIERQGRQYTVPVLRGPFPGQLASVGASKLTVATASLPGASDGGRSASVSSSTGGGDQRLSASDPQIKIFRHSADTDAVYREAVNSELKMPASIRSALAGFGVTMMITPTLLDAIPELATERPDGYTHGGSFVNCPGMYRGAEKVLYVPERVQHGSNVPTLNTRMSEVVLHEFGHAFDHCRNNISHSEVFMSAYQADSGRLTNGVREQFYYYTNAERGNIELFAQLFSCAVRPEGSIDTHDQNLCRTFPTCFALMKKIVAGG